jgi:hypothetical protein
MVYQILNKYFQFQEFISNWRTGWGERPQRESVGHQKAAAEDAAAGREWGGRGE